MEEIWKIYPKATDYEVSSLGRVRRRVYKHVPKQAKEIKTYKRKDNGYWGVNLRNNAGAKVRLRLNRVVCETFHGEPPTALHQAAHNDGNKDHNTESNLAWKTPVENAKDALDAGNYRRGENHGSSKITAEIANYIAHYDIKPGDGCQELAEKFGLTNRHVRNIREGKTWSNTTGIDPLSYRPNQNHWATKARIAKSEQSKGIASS